MAAAMQSNITVVPLVRVANLQNMCYNLCMDTCKVYTLSDPRTGTIRYVGRTVQTLQQRLANHIGEARKGKLHPRAVWIRSVLDSGFLPTIAVVDSVPNENARNAEREWTKRLLDQGCDLVNSNLAGGGCTYPKKRAKWTPETLGMLGKVADAVIADMVGVTRKAVSYERTKLGIEAPFDRTRNVPPPPMAGHNRVELSDDVIALLGTMPDYKLAAIAGVSKKRIIAERHRRSVSSFAEQTGNTGQYKKGNFPARWLQNK